MRDKAHFVTPLERLMVLKGLPYFGGLPARYLAVLAEHAREVHFRRGEVLFRQGEPVPAIHALVRGEVRVSRQGEPFRRFRERDAVGVIGLLAQTAEGVEAVAQTEGISLALSRDVLFDIFEDHFAVLDHVLRRTAEILSDERRRLGSNARYTPVATMLSPQRRLDLLERIFVLQKALPFTVDSPDGLGQLATMTREVRHDAGEVLWREGDETDRFLVLVSGKVEHSRRGETLTASSGHALGIVDVVAQRQRLHTATVKEPIVALSLDAEALLDVFEDHFEMGVACLALMGRFLLDIYESRARLADSLPTGLVVDAVQDGASSGRSRSSESAR